MHTYASMQINDITGHYDKNKTVSWGRGDAYYHTRYEVVPVRQRTFYLLHIKYCTILKIRKELSGITVNIFILVL